MTVETYEGVVEKKYSTKGYNPSHGWDRTGYGYTYKFFMLLSDLETGKPFTEQGEELKFMVTVKHAGDYRDQARVGDRVIVTCQKTARTKVGWRGVTLKREFTIIEKGEVPTHEATVLKKGWKKTNSDEILKQFFKVEIENREVGIMVTYPDDKYYPTIEDIRVGEKIRVRGHIVEGDDLDWLYVHLPDIERANTPEPVQPTNTAII